MYAYIIIYSPRDIKRYKEKQKQQLFINKKEKKMKKFIYLMAMVCTLGFFTACSSDDDNDEKEFVRNEKIEGTWNLQEVTKQDLGNGSEWYNGSAKFTWDCPEGTVLNIDMGGGFELPMDINTVIYPLMNNMANEYLPKVLKDITFTKDGQINATYAEASDDENAVPEWKTAMGYASYTVANENLIYVTIDADKATADIDDAAEKAQIKGILEQFKQIPVNIRWNGSKPYFFVDKAFVQPMIASLVIMIEKVPITDMDEEDLKQFNMLKSILNQLPPIMDKTTKFEAGLELIK